LTEDGAVYLRGVKGCGDGVRPGVAMEQQTLLDWSGRLERGRQMSRARTGGVALLVILGALAVFHILMLFGALPGEIAWGGQAAGSPGTLRILETVGLVVTLLFAAAVAAKAGLIGGPVLRRPAGIAMWVVFAYFVLNALGNLASMSGVERAVFTPVSLVAALLALRLALE